MRTPRHALVPNANNPELLARLLEMVSRGVRSSRALSEALSVDVRTVGYYTQAGEWLGLVDVVDEVTLTPLGLEFVYATDERPLVYSRAVWANPVVAELLIASDDSLPSVAAVSEVVRKLAPDMAKSTVRRRASAIRSLIGPAIGIRRSHVRTARQIALPFAATRPSHPERPTVLRDDEHDPDAYRYVLSALLDHGELGLPQIRGLLDRAGATRAPIGGYIAMAAARGDAERVGNVLVASHAAGQRAELIDSTASVILSDAGYRGYLEDLRLSPTDPRASERVALSCRRYATWDERLFGERVDAASLDLALSKVVLDRPLATFPIALPGIPAPHPATGPFLSLWEHPHLRIACPPTLTGLQGGIASVNRALKLAREQTGVTNLPSLVDRPTTVHGALVHPGQPLPRAVPDTRSLRLTVIAHAPYVTLVTALLLTHRLQPARLVLHRDKGTWRVRWDDQDLGPVFEVLDDFARSREWIVLRRSVGGLPDGALLDTLESLGIASTLGRQAVLSERFFAHLRAAPEEAELHDRLAPLAATLEDRLGERATS